MIDFDNLASRSQNLGSLPPEIISRIVSAFVDFFFSYSSDFPYLGEVITLLSPAEVDDLRCQLPILLTDLFDPKINNETLISHIENIGTTYASIGIRPAWIMALNQRFIEIALTHLADLDIDRNLIDKYCLGASIRLELLARSVLYSEMGIEDELESLVDQVNDMVGQATTSADLIRNFLSILQGLDGVEMVAFGRPDSEGVVQYEYYVGDGFLNYQQHLEIGTIVPISIRSDSPSGMGPSGKAFRSGRVETCDSIATDPGMDPWRSDLLSINLRSGVGIPVVAASGDVVAVINGYSKVLGYFGVNRRRRTLEHVAHIFGAALSRLDTGDQIISHSDRSLFRSLLYGGGLEIVYQPIVDLRSGDLYKVEALARLRDSNGDLLSPAQFLRAFGSDDLFYLFDQGLNKGLSAILAWRSHGLFSGLGVNFPPQGMFDDRYIRSIERNLEETGVDPSLLTLELTEDEELLQGNGISPTVLQRARNMGVHLAQDDLGAGYSSLLRLESVGFDEVKIDQELVRSPAEVAHSVDLVAHLTDLAHDLGMNVVVEGLEDDALVEAVAILGADYGQGYGLGRPVDFEAIIEWYHSFRYNEPVGTVRTPLGALAYLRKWSRRVIAMETFLYSIDVTDLVADLRLKIGGSNDYLIDQRIGQFLDDSRKNAGLGSLLRLEEDLARIINLKLDSVRSIPVDDATEPSAARQNPLNSISLRQMKDIYLLQGRLLGEIEKGLSASEVINKALIEVEILIPHSIGCVSLLDSFGKANIVWAPSLPYETWPLLTDISNATSNGSDATAGFSERVAFESIVRFDPRWSQFGEAAEELGVSASWSIPLRDQSLKTIGILSVLKSREGLASEFDSMLLETIGSIISLCLKLKQVDEVQTRRQEYLSELFELPTSYKFLINSSTGEIANANREAVDRSGYSKDELHKLSFFDLAPQLDREVPLYLQLNFDITNQWAGELTVRDKFGEFCVMRYHAMFRGLGREPELFVALYEGRDGDELVVQLRHERTLNDRIMDSVAAAVMVVNEKGQITRFNRGAEQLTGFTSLEVFENPTLWRNWIDEDDQSLVVETFLSVLEFGGSAVNEIWHHHRDGNKRLVETHYSSVVRDRRDTNAAVVLYGVDVTQRSRDAALVREDLDFVAQVIEAIPRLIYVLDRSCRVIRCNRAVLDFTGAKLAEIGEAPFQIVEYFAPDDRTAVRAWFADALAGNVREKAISTWVRRDGVHRTIEWHSSIIYGHDGKASSFVVVGTDITEQRIAESQLRKAAVVFEHTAEAIVIIDANSQIIDINPACIRMTGFEREEVIGKTSRFFAPNPENEVLWESMNDALRTGGHWSGSVQQRRKDGSVFATFVNISTIFSNLGQPDFYVALFSDITDLMDYQDKLAKLAYFDFLTELPNRSFVGEKMADQLAINRRFGGMTALAFLDLDNFKPVNDRYGHKAGDTLLITLARRIKDAVREIDTVARIGGDEFVCILGSIDEFDTARGVIGRMMEAIATPISISEDRTEWVTITASVGVAFSKTANDDLDSLLRRADLLMYEAKARGGNCYVLEGEDLGTASQNFSI